MKIQFIGATGTVTGSKYLLTQNSHKFLIDCGLFQGLKVLRLRNWSPLPFSANEINAVILTHAHIDHSGALPLLIKNGFRGKIYATAATKALCNILLPDAGYLQEEDAQYANKHGFSKHKPALPLFTREDAIESLNYFKEMSWKEKNTLAPELNFEFHRAGHILGAAMVKLFFGKQSITFSGDLGRSKDLLMNPPEQIHNTDYLVVESTYGDRKHPSENPKDTLKQLINKTIKRGGTVLIPAFAVGRAQELLHLVAELKNENAIPNVPVYLNSPMAINATRIFCDFLDDHNLSADECDELSRVSKFVSTVEESKKLNAQNEPSIIISASGMATGGRVLHHLKVLAPDEKNLILFVGFQAAGTRGEAMLRGVKEIKMHGQMIPVKAEVAQIEGLSAHADCDEIMSWLKGFSRAPKMTFITHGEPLAAEALRKRIETELGWQCKVPDYLETCDL